MITYGTGTDDWTQNKSTLETPYSSEQNSHPTVFNTSNEANRTVHTVETQVLRMLVTWAVHRPIVVEHHTSLLYVWYSTTIGRWGSLHFTVPRIFTTVLRPRNRITSY